MNLDRVKWAATQVIALAAPDAIGLWKPAAYPRRPSNGAAIVTAQFARAPGVRTLEKVQRDEPLSLLLTVAAPTAGSRIGLCVSSVVFGADVPGATPTAEEARDALLAAFSDERGGLAAGGLAVRLLPGVTISAVGTDSIRLLATSPGMLYAHRVFGPGLSRTIETIQPSEVVTGRAVGTLEFEAFAAGAAPNAEAMLGTLELALAGHDSKAVQAETGVVLGPRVGDIVPLNSLAGATWESRATVRCAVTLRSYRAVAVDYIETIATTATISSGDGAQTSTEQYETTAP